MRLAVLLFICGVAINEACAQSKAPLTHDVILTISIASDQHEFHIGEVIPLELSFTSPFNDRYQVNMAQYDRSGRMEYEQFTIFPTDGAVDPLVNRKGIIAGGLTGFKFLSTDPWTIKLNLNEWVRFTKPGEYRLSTISGRIAVKNPPSQGGASAVTVAGNDLMLKIKSLTPDWQKTVIDGAVAVLDKTPPSKPADMDAYLTARRSSLETLRFLGTPEAIKELADRMPDETLGGLQSVCALGLISAPDRDAARAAMEESLGEPKHAIDGGFLSTLRTLSNDSPDHAVQELLAAIPAKHGKALSVSLSTAVNEAWNGAVLPKQVIDGLVQRLIASFDELPPEEQRMLLMYRWDKISGPDMIPILRRYSQNSENLSDLSGSALQHWFELDPGGARPAIIKEIMQPRPRYDARVLGILPDKTLPEVETSLADNLIASDDYDAASHVASLIARYAGPAILQQVLARLDPMIGKWACAIQNPLLAYVLRVNPALAQPRIEQALAARGEGFTACNHGLLPQIYNINYDPALEDIAVRSLDDSDPQIAQSAAGLLGAFGSSSAEAPLWAHYISWNEKWQSRETELSPIDAEIMSRQIPNAFWERQLGETLQRAIVTGKSWLTDESKLYRLSNATTVKQLRQGIDSYLKIWNRQPLTISLTRSPDSAGINAAVAQYEFETIEALEKKLAQFPQGTMFYLSVRPAGASAGDQQRAEIRAFLSTNGFVVAGEK